jgi:hypothetical protein
MKYKLFTAKEARLNANQRKHYSQEFRFIMGEIKKQSNKGFYSVTINTGCNTPLSKKELKYLNQAGYTYIFNSVTKEFIIKW